MLKYLSLWTWLDKCIDILICKIRYLSMFSLFQGISCHHWMILLIIGIMNYWTLTSKSLFQFLHKEEDKTFFPTCSSTQFLRTQNIVLFLFKNLFVLIFLKLLMSTCWYYVIDVEEYLDKRLRNLLLWFYIFCVFIIYYFYFFDMLVMYKKLW